MAVYKWHFVVFLLLLAIINYVKITNILYKVNFSIVYVKALVQRQFTQFAINPDMPAIGT